MYFRNLKMEGKGFIICFSWLVFFNNRKVFYYEIFVDVIFMI